MRLAALYSHPTQYAAPLFRELSARSGVDLTVYFMSRQGLDVTFDPNFGTSFQWDVPLLGGYSHKFLPNLRKARGVTGFWDLCNFSVIPELRMQPYDALLVHGYEHFAKWLAFFAAPPATRLILRGESHLNEPRGLFRRGLKRIVLGSLFHRFHSFACLGELNRRYYQSYGVSPERLYFAPYSVDNAFFREARARLYSRRQELRAAIGIYDAAPVIISVAKLISVKQPLLLLRAFAKIRRQQACHLVLVGDGELREAVLEEARQTGIPDVHITGFVNQTRIPEMHVCGDIFVLPSSHEPWGLAVNEAMAAGLPVIVTDRVGCSGDLVLEGVNGYIVRYDDIHALAMRLSVLVGSQRLRSEFGSRSAERIEQYSLAATADGILEAALGTLPPIRPVGSELPELQ